MFILYSLSLLVHLPNTTTFLDPDLDHLHLFPLNTHRHSSSHTHHHYQPSSSNPPPTTVS
ncbi:hypothetical protein HanIR_Chr12g0611231 [Helianthus annuus]|nr:hypothetical protein HanIR_Chr12g0611231 [Helianthus annuus]